MNQIHNKLNLKSLIMNANELLQKNKADNFSVDFLLNLFYCFKIFKNERMKIYEEFSYKQLKKRKTKFLNKYDKKILIIKKYSYLKHNRTCKEKNACKN